MTNEEKIYRWIDGHIKRAMKEADWIWFNGVSTWNANYHTIKVIVDKKRNTITVINTENPKRFGKSKCRSDDEFGVALAYARYSKETIPDYVMNELNK